jgi:hypothetical protein
MTETKEDIQVQIDQLELEWLRNLDGYKVKHQWGALITPVAGSSLDISMLLLLLIAFPVGLVWYLWHMGPLILEGFNGEDTVPLIFTLWPGIALIITFVLLLRLRRKFLKAAVIYDEALKAYQQERSRLQSRLNSAKMTSHD